MNAGTKVHAVYTDFSKAFDKVDHETLLMKLQNYGINGTALKLFHSYLVDRRLQVKVDSHLSKEYEVISGVPQISHLGPLLFNMFVNDIGKHFKSEYLLYADDLKIFRIIREEQDKICL